MKPTLLKRRRTKIIATIGPSSGDPAVIERLIAVGVNIFRLNLSHGDHAVHRTSYERIRSVAARLGEPVAVLADLGGPKIRGDSQETLLLRLAPTSPSPPATSWAVRASSPPSTPRWRTTSTRAITFCWTTGSLSWKWGR